MRIHRTAIGLVAIALAFSFAVPRSAQANTVGKAASDFTLRTHDGKQLTLSKLEGKRGAVLVFFATWCPSCMAEVPAVRKFANAAKNKNVLVYGVNIQQSQRIVERFVKDHQVNYRILLDTDAAVAKSYGITGIPTVIGVDADGIVRYREHRIPRDAIAFIKTLTAPLAKKAATKQAPTGKKLEKGGDYVKDGVHFVSKETLKKWTDAKRPPLIIDVLSAQSYQKVRIKGAVNIPLQQLRKQAAKLDKKRKIVVYCAGYQCSASTQAAKMLGRLGFQNVYDYKGGIKEWQAARLPVEKPGAVKLISREDLLKLTRTHGDLVIVDVLAPASYKQAHIKGAINIPLGKLEKRAGELNKDSKIVVYCASFHCHASTAAAKKLMALGFKDVSDYKGGITEWQAAGLSVERGK